MLFIIGGWFCDRRLRRKRAALSRRLFALAAYSACVLLLFVAVRSFYPSSWKLHTTNSAVMALGYGVGLGWLSIPVIAIVSCVAAAVAGVIVLFTQKA
jgi:hypothetical protein